MVKYTTISRLKRRIFKHVWTIRIFLILVAAAILSLFFIAASQYIRRSALGNYVDPAKNFILGSTSPIKNDIGRTNILILGRGGEGHEAPDLTDTIIFASVTQNSSTLISIPRDIWIDDLQAKLNSSFYWGKKNGGSESSGLSLAKKSAEEVVGQPIHYAVVVDFSVFTRIIDSLGGIPVQVERSFTDYKYPIAGRENDLCGGDPDYKCRYETISFNEGLQVMDGATALKFSRSRHAEGDEGTDFARASRQQKVIDAIRAKVISTELIFNPTKISELINIAETSVLTDITKDESAAIARIAFLSRDKLSTYVMGEELFDRPPISQKYQKQYVLIPKNEDWKQLHEWVRSILETPSTVNKPN